MNKLCITTLASSLLLFTGSIAGAQTGRARIPDTPIREEANLASAIMATLKEGSTVDVVDLQGDWYRVLVPHEPGKARIGYVLAHLIDIVNTDGSPQSLPAPTVRAARPSALGPSIPPTLAQLSPPHDKATEREHALKQKMDAAQADLKALQDEQPIGQIGSDKVPRPAARHSQEREGIWFNAGLGFGSAGCNGCGGGFSGGLSLGVTINDRLLVGVGTSGWVDGSALSAGTLDARVRFYPVRTSGFFLTGGIGLGHVSDAFETGYGVGMVFGAGWDVPIRPNLSLTPFWNGFSVGTSTSTVGVGQFGIGITVH